MKHYPCSFIDQVNSKAKLVKAYPVAAHAAAIIYLAIVNSKIANDRTSQTSNNTAGRNGDPCPDSTAAQEAETAFREIETVNSPENKFPQVCNEKADDRYGQDKDNECGNQDLRFWIVAFMGPEAGIYDNIENPTELEKIALRTKTEDFLNFIRWKASDIGKTTGEAYRAAGNTPQLQEGTGAKNGPIPSARKPRKRWTQEECVSAYLERKYNRLESKDKKKEFLGKLISFDEKKKELMYGKNSIEYCL